MADLKPQHRPEPPRPALRCEAGLLNPATINAGVSSSSIQM